MAHLSDFDISLLNEIKDRAFNAEGRIYIDTVSVEYPVFRISEFLKDHDDYLVRTIKVDKANIIIIDANYYLSNSYSLNVEERLWIETILNERPNQIYQIDRLINEIGIEYNLTQEFYDKICQLLNNRDTVKLGMSYMASIDVEKNLMRLTRLYELYRNTFKYNHFKNLVMWKGMEARIRNITGSNWIYNLDVKTLLLNYKTVLDSDKMKFTEVIVYKKDLKDYINYVTREWKQIYKNQKEDNGIVLKDETFSIDIDYNAFTYMEDELPFIKERQITYELEDDMVQSGI